MPFGFTQSRVKGLTILGLFILGAIAYVPPYVLILEDFDKRSASPFIEVATFLNSMGGRDGVFTRHPDLLARYYKGPVYELPEKGEFEYILEEAKKKGVRYLIIDSTSVNSLDLFKLYFYSVYGGRRGIPSEFVLVKDRRAVYALYLIQTQVSFKAAIFGHLEWGFHASWETTLALIGASTSTFDDTTIISNIDFSEFHIVIFADFVRPLDDAERLHLEEAVENGLTVIVSGLSPYFLAGGTTNLTRISSWFGASVFSEAPREARWKVGFTENATEILKDLDLNREYEFYKDKDWSTPTGCLVEPESVIYAYRVKDQAATIFSHKFGKGISIFNGPRHGFGSPDAQTFELFLRALILSALE